jgi:hypothetical protein
VNAIFFLLNGQTSFSPCPETADDTGQQGNEHHDDDDDLDMPVDSRDVVPEEVANPQHTPHPSDGAEHIVREKFAEFHPAHAGDYRRKRPDNGHELRDHDCRVPVPFLKFPGADSMLLVEEEAVFPIENPGAGGATDEITERIAYDCSEREGGSQLVHVQIPTRCEQAGGNQEGISW